MMKKLLSLMLAMSMTVALCACGGSQPAASTDTAASTETAQASTESTETAAATTYTKGNDVPDEMTSADGKYQIALVTDVGQLKDGSFNEGTWNGVKLYAANNGKSYKYYQPANGSEATDDDRYDAMAAAADAGAELIVAPGFLQATALEKAAKAYPDTHFLFIDGWDLGLANVKAVAYKEHECGYFAGYAVVKEGYTKLGFCGGGGGTNPACCRYGYGFVQGANAAAAELGVNVDIQYTWLYGSTYSPSTELETLVNGWYTNGTECVFACGGTLCQSVFSAAAKNDGVTIGVDVDQSGDSDTVITSAMKELANSVQQMAAKNDAGEWDKLEGCVTLGAADGDTGIPTENWKFQKFTVDGYQAMFKSVAEGTLQIDSDYESNFGQDYSNVTVNVVE